MFTEFGTGSVKERDHLTDLGVNGKNITLGLKGIRRQVVGWNFVTLDRGK
jgi:hypothetical protein